MSTSPAVQRNSTVFSYNRTFGSPPSPTSNTAWKALFPPQAGFFRHPELAPERSTFSAFHALHCLDGIRHGYWALYGAATGTEQNHNVSPDRLNAVPLDPNALPMMASPPHIRHCIDLLRQTLMCQPDVTIEVKDESLGGVQGFGAAHQCQDWKSLVAWTHEWESWDQQQTDGKGIIQ